MRQSHGTALLRKLAAAWLAAAGWLPVAGGTATSVTDPAAGADRVAGEALVIYQTGAGDVAARAVDHGAVVVGEFPALSGGGGRVIRHLRATSATTAELLASLRQDPAVASAEPNYLRRLCAMPVPNDPGFPQQWGLDNTGQTIITTSGTPGADIRFLEGWGMADPELPETVVAVIDNGAELNHLDLVDNLWSNPGEIPWDGIDNDTNGRIDDIHGFNYIGNNGNPSNGVPPAGSPANGEVAYQHGTWMAGIIAATGNNSEGIIGAAFRSRVMVLRAGTNDIIDVASSIAAINHAVMMKSRGVNLVAINASYASPNPSAAEQAAIQAAGDAGIVFCCAAGNYGTDNTAVPYYPANYRLPNMIVVAASDSNDALIPESNYGTLVDLAAPGDLIRTTKTIWPNYTGVAASLGVGGTGYAAQPVFFSGTSTGVSGTLYACGMGQSTADFPAAVNGNIALIERGVLFSTSFTNAMLMGARGVVIYNNTSTTSPSLGDANAWIPGVFISRADGLALLPTLPATATLSNLPFIPSYAYAYPWGTSVATPFVTAAVAFAAANFPSETAVQRVARIIDGTAPAGTLAGRVRSSGRLDLSGIIDPGHNQLPDWWESRYFGTVNVSAGGDPDGDGFTNLQEYRIGTIPTTPFSRLTITSGAVVPNGAARDFHLTFPTARDVVYRTEHATDLSHWQALGADLPGTGEPATVTDPDAANQHPRRFYRVRIVQP